MNEINRRSIRRYTALVEDLFACSCTPIEIVFVIEGCGTPSEENVNDARGRASGLSF